MSDDNDEHNWLREARHNPCLMSPLSALIMLILLVVSAITMIINIPAFFLGLLVAPLARRTPWFIEFLYPTGLARWGHFFLIKSARNSKKSQHGHSRTLEQRFEVIKGRVYIHFLPQLLDNLGYLVVCLPTSATKTIVAFVVDCGDANEVLDTVHAIQEMHYVGYEIELQSILCTHKHHDHTGGNKSMLKQVDIRQVVGGAVERVPYCTTEVANGDMLVLPSVSGNDMNQVLEVEVMAMPAHTRGSVVYAMRTKEKDDDDEDLSFLFVGDTMFSGGGGVPFEADIETRRDERVSTKTGSSHVKPSAGSKAVERCFAELLYRGCNSPQDDTAASRLLVFPGHEYTSDLIYRQFRSGGGGHSQWNRMPPSVFFETASQLYVASHRRALPHNGKLLTVPTVISRELDVNPHYRSLKKRGEHVIRAIRVWHRHFCATKLEEVSRKHHDTSSRALCPPKNDVNNNKTPSTESQWNLTADDVRRPIFTTVYAAELEELIDELKTASISPQKAAKKLKAIKSNLQDYAIYRRPVPGTLPSEKNVYLGILGLAILGAGPCAMTLSDSRAMNLPPPMDASSDRIRISKRRLLSVLNGLGLLTAAHDGHDVIQMIHLLWKDAAEYNDVTEASVENAENGTEVDEIDLGVLKWALYGAEANQPSWFSKFCMPCNKETKKKKATRTHPVQSLNIRRTGAELVRHDVHHCPLCRDATGCPLGTEVVGEEDESEGRAADAVEEEIPHPDSHTSVEVALPAAEIKEEGSIPFDESIKPFDEEESETEGSEGTERQSVQQLLSEA